MGAGVPLVNAPVACNGFLAHMRAHAERRSRHAGARPWAQQAPILPLRTLPPSSTHPPADIAHQALLMQRVAEHWDALAPRRVLHVRYEDLVRDQVSTARPIAGLSSTEIPLGACAGNCGINGLVICHGRMAGPACPAGRRHVGHSLDGADHENGCSAWVDPLPTPACLVDPTPHMRRSKSCGLSPSTAEFPGTTSF